MKLAFAALLLVLSSCASIPGKRMYVQWPDDSEKEKLWTCFQDEENERAMTCVDWGTFLKYVRQKALEDEIEEMHWSPSDPDHTH